MSYCGGRNCAFGAQKARLRSSASNFTAKFPLTCKIFLPYTPSVKKEILSNINKALIKPGSSWRTSASISKSNRQVDFLAYIKQNGEKTL